MVRSWITGQLCLIFLLSSLSFVNAANDSDVNASALGQLNGIAIFFLVLALLLGLIISILWIFHTKIYYKFIDVPKYLYVIKYFQNVIDLWTDFLFCYTMYLKHDFTRFYLSVTFIILPTLCSLCLISYWLYRWRTMTVIVHQRVTDYLEEFSMILVVFTLISSFGAAIEMAQSKFNYKKMFCLPLRKQENDELRVWSFLNNTILEALPQFIIQITYVLSINSGDNLGFAVTFSILFTCLTLLFSFASTVVTFLKLYIEHSVHVSQITEIGIKMTLNCDQFISKHKFIYEVFHKSILNVLRTCQHSKYWIDRSDVELTIEVFYINGDRIILNHEIDCYFEAKLTCYNNTDNNSGVAGQGDISALLSSTLREFSINESPIYEKFCQMTKSQLKTKDFELENLNIANISILFERTVNINKENENVEIVTRAQKTSQVSQMSVNNNNIYSMNNNNNNNVMRSASKSISIDAGIINSSVYNDVAGIDLGVLPPQPQTTDQRLSIHQSIQESMEQPSSMDNAVSKKKNEFVIEKNNNVIDGGMRQGGGVTADGQNIDKIVKLINLVENNNNNNNNMIDNNNNMLNDASINDSGNNSDDNNNPFSNEYNGENENAMDMKSNNAITGQI